jgi:hypothetical protein
MPQLHLLHLAVLWVQLLCGCLVAYVLTCLVFEMKRTRIQLQSQGYKVRHNPIGADKQ